jgi:AAA+ superfamily predicted ATPase
MLRNQNTRLFVEYLDNVKKESDIDYNKFFLNVDNDYITNQYYKTVFCGIHIPKYSNKSGIDPKSCLSVIPPETKKVCIDTNIQSVDDLIHIVETHNYENGVEYNIDLKSLHNIKMELCELRDMIGMGNVKSAVLEQLLYFMQGLHLGGSLGGDFKHTVIYGPPGTGKTEVAKIIGRMYSKLGILKNNVFKKVTRNDLVAGYLGQTALKTKQVIEDCSGGVLFIDEAYSLASNNDLDSFSKECIDTLCEALSDKKDELMVIIAGYEHELNQCFFAANQGLDSRFIWRFKIDSYNSSELRNIFLKKVKMADWQIDNVAVDTKWFDKHKAKFKHYGRDMELLFFYTKIAHSKRIYGKVEEVKRYITLEDVTLGFNTFLKNTKKENEIRKEIIESLYV